MSIIACHLVITLINQSCTSKSINSVTAPVSIDHNRMIVKAEVKTKDGTWKKVRLWVDSGNPVFTLNADLAIDLGTEPSANEISELKNPKLKIGSMVLNTDNVSARFQSQPFWIFSSLHCDGNLPSTILKKYDVIFDYPKREMTLAEPGKLKHKGIKCDALIHPETGIVQIKAMIDKDSMSFALDNGASYSFISQELLSGFSENHPEWNRITGTAGYANMWGWWPANEQLFSVVKIAGMRLGDILLDSLGIAGVPKFGSEGPSLGEWYSKKTLEKVCGFIGANALKPYRVEIDYGNNAVYFEETSSHNENDMSIVGISLRQLADSTYQVTGIVNKQGFPVVEGIRQGDTILSINGYKVKGETMGKVVDALRGKPGEVKTISFLENGLIRSVNTNVMKLL